MIFFTIQIDKKEPSFSAVAELDLLISITTVFLSEKGEKLFYILHEQNTHIYIYTFSYLRLFFLASATSNDFQFEYNIGIMMSVFRLSLEIITCYSCSLHVFIKRIEELCRVNGTNTKADNCLYFNL